jgi:hypothetical protein
LAFRATRRPVLHRARTVFTYLALPPLRVFTAPHLAVARASGASDPAGAGADTSSSAAAVQNTANWRCGIE